VVVVLGPSHILLVDDEEAFRYAAAKTLQDAGFHVTVAEDYRGALARLESAEPVDLLVADIVMSVNGFALARMGRMRRAGLKVLYVTAHDVPTHEAIGKILRKPISDEQLISEVRSALAA
jgi:CheY-like chemotaxis protein